METDDGFATICVVGADGWLVIAESLLLVV